MHSRILAQRNADASANIVKRAGELAEKFGVSGEVVEALSKTERDPDVTAMVRLEAVADLLHQVNAAPVYTDSEVDAEVEARAVKGQEVADAKQAEAIKDAVAAALVPVQDELKAAQDALVEAGGKYRMDKDALLQRIADLEAAAAKPQAEPQAENAEGTGTAQLDNKPEVTPLPEGFPKRAQLAKAGITTVEAVNEKPVDQLAKVDGITPQTAEQVKQSAAVLGQAG